jgi:DNA-binding transcriptional ArsR family regulator
MARQPHTGRSAPSGASKPAELHVIIDELLADADDEFHWLLDRVSANRRKRSKLLAVQRGVTDEDAWDPDQPLRVNPSCFLDSRFDPTGRKSFVLRLLAANPHSTVRAADVRAALLADEGATAGEMTPKVVDQLLHRMADAGLVVRYERGRYRLPTFNEAIARVSTDGLGAQALRELLEEWLM